MRKINLVTTSINSLLSQPKKGVKLMIAKRIFLASLITGVMAVLVMLLGTQSNLWADSQPGHTLEGSWLVTVNPEGIPPFENLSTFTSGGSIINTPETASESVGHGTWVRTRERRFAVTFISFFYDEMGNISGKGKVRATSTLNRSSDEFSGPFIFEIFDLTGNVVFSVTGTVQATRINVEPLP